MAAADLRASAIRQHPVASLLVLLIALGVADGRSTATAGCRRHVPLAWRAPMHLRSAAASSARSGSAIAHSTGGQVASAAHSSARSRSCAVATGMWLAVPAIAVFGFASGGNIDPDADQLAQPQQRGRVAGSA
jgi:hypothetical protein